MTKKRHSILILLLCFMFSMSGITGSFAADSAGADQKQIVHTQSVYDDDGEDPDEYVYEDEDADDEDEESDDEDGYEDDESDEAEDADDEDEFEDEESDDEDEESDEEDEDQDEDEEEIVEDQDKDPADEDKAETDNKDSGSETTEKTADAVVEELIRRPVTLEFRDVYLVNGEETTEGNYRVVLLKNFCHEDVLKTTEDTETESLLKETYEGKDAEGRDHWLIEKTTKVQRSVITTHSLNVLTTSADKLMKSLKKSEPSCSKYLDLKAKQKKAGYGLISLKWSKFAGAEGYIIYRSRCGKSSYKRIGTTRQTFFDSNSQKQAKYYKFIVVAVDKSGNILSVSRSTHVTTKGGKYTNPAKLKVNKTKVKLKKGKTFRIKASVRYKGVSVHQDLRYVSTDKRIVKVNGKGVIKARAKGSCIIYVYAQNGLRKKIKVRVS